MIGYPQSSGVTKARLDRFFVRVFDCRPDGLTWATTEEAMDERACLSFARAAAEEHAAAAAYSEGKHMAGGGLTRIGVFGQAAVLIKMDEFL